MSGVLSSLLGGSRHDQVIFAQGPNLLGLHAGECLRVPTAQWSVGYMREFATAGTVCSITLPYCSFVVVCLGRWPWCFASTCHTIF